MAERPYLLVSCAMSVDGHIDDTSQARLILSSEADADRVDEVRAGCDAILVGARTIRRDNPRLLIRSPERRAGRQARGAAVNPAKVTVTATGNLDPAARFFAGDGTAKLVYCARPALAATRARLSGLAEVIDAGDSPSPALLAGDLAERGVARVLLEGGGELAAEFLVAGLADELHLVIAPFFVGDPAAPRFAGPASYPHGPASPMQLAEVRQLGDVVLLRYLLGTRHPAQAPAAQIPAAGARRPAGAAGGADDIRWLRQAIELLSSEEDPGPPPPLAGRPPGPAAAGLLGSGEDPGPPPPLAGRPSGPAAAGLLGSGEDPGPPPPLAGRPSGPAAAGLLGSGEDPGPPPPLAGRPSGPAAAGLLGSGEDPGPPPPLAGRPSGPAAADPYGARPADEPPSADPPGNQSPGPAPVDIRWLDQAIELSRHCPPSRTAFSVGAAIVAADGTLIATAFSREADPHDHAEEAALAKVPPGDPRLPTATLYSSLEPCGVRASRPHPCAELIIAAGLRRVVYAWREPPLLAAGGGGQQLRAAGAIVIEVPELAPRARQVNAHLIDPAGPFSP